MLSRIYFLGKMPKRQKSWDDKEDRMDLLSNIALV